MLQLDKIEIREDSYSLGKIWCDRVIPIDCKEGLHCGMGIMTEFIISKENEENFIDNKIPQNNEIIYISGENNIKIPLSFNKIEIMPDRNNRNNLRIHMTAFIVPEMFPEKTIIKRP